MKKIMKYSLLLIIAFTFNTAYSGDPIPGIDITLKNAETKKILKTKTDRNGKYSFKKLSAGTYTITVSSEGKSFTFGDKKKDQIVIASSSQKVGNDKVVRKRPGRVKYGDITLSRALSDVIMEEHASSSSRKSNEGIDYNSSRSNKSNSVATDTDDDGFGDTGDNQRKSTRKERKSRRRVEVLKSNKTASAASPKLTVNVNKNSIRGHITVVK